MRLNPSFVCHEMIVDPWELGKRWAAVGLPGIAANRYVGIGPTVCLQCRGASQTAENQTPLPDE